MHRLKGYTMTRLNDSADSFSLNELRNLTGDSVHTLDSEWLEAITEWADDPDMVLVLTGKPLDNALAKVTNRFSPRMACARMLADYFRHLSGCKQNYIPAKYKMVCEIVNLGKSSSRPANELHGIRQLWVWHK